MTSTILILTLLAAEPGPAADSVDAVKKGPDWPAGAARLTSTFLSGFQSGWLVGSKLWVSPVREGYQDGGEWIRLQGSLNHTVGPAAPIMMGSAALGNLLPLLFDHDLRKISTWLTILGGVFNGAIIVSTMIGNVPVNNITAVADPANPPANWQQLRSQWETFHTVRSVFSVTAFTLNLGAIVFAER
jgi:hypothetical protein